MTSCLTAFAFDVEWTSTVTIRKICNLREIVIWQSFPPMKSTAARKRLQQHIGEVRAPQAQSRARVHVDPRSFPEKPPVH